MSGAPGGPIAQSGSGMLAVRARHALLRSSAASAVGRRLIAASAAPGGDEVAGGDDRTDDTVLSGRMELGRASRPAKPALLASESSRRASGADAAPRRLFARSMSASAPRSLGPIPSPRTLGPIPAPTRVPREAPPPAEPAEPSEAPAAAEEASGANWFANGSTYEIQNADFLQKLSDEQIKPVTAPIGAIMVEAGPGSGKTRVLTTRIAYLVRELHVPPMIILAVSFTKRASQELKTRLDSVLGFVDSGVTLGTFHSVALYLLRMHAASFAELTPQDTNPDAAGRFVVLDEDDSRVLMRKVVMEELSDILDRNEAGEPMKQVKGVKLADYVKTLQKLVSRTKQYVGVVSPGQTFRESYERAREASMGSKLRLPDYWANLIDSEYERIWEGYHRRMRESRMVDFDDIIGLTVEMLRRYPTLRDRLRLRYPHVLVDEFQDTNSLQYALLKCLCPVDGASLFVVGDVNQSIYGWRGADVSNMETRFMADFKGAEVFTLQDNYRSSNPVVQVAMHVINSKPEGLKEAEGRREEERRTVLRAVNQEESVPVHVLGHTNRWREMEWIARAAGAMSQALQHRGKHAAGTLLSVGGTPVALPPSLDDVAVLARTNRTLMHVERELLSLSVPYEVVGALPFWMRAEVKDVMAYLRVAVNPRDEVALERIINKPRRGLGNKSLEKMQAWAKETHGAGSLCAALLHGWEEVLVDEGVQDEVRRHVREAADCDSKWYVALRGLYVELRGQGRLGPTAKGGAVGGAAKVLSKKQQEAVEGLRARLFAWMAYLRTLRVRLPAGGDGSDDEGPVPAKSAAGAVGDFVRAVIDDADYLDALDEGLLDGEDDDNDSWEQARRGAGKGREQSSREKVERRQENVIMLGGFLGASAREVIQQREGSEMALVDLLSGVMQVALVEVDATDKLAEVQGEGRVKLMTIHTAKGTEFHTVMMVRCEDGVYPRGEGFFVKDPTSTADPGNSPEEDKRVLYVGATRAKSQLFVLYNYEAARFLPPDGAKKNTTGIHLGLSPFLMDAIRDKAHVRHYNCA